MLLAATLCRGALRCLNTVTSVQKRAFRLNKLPSFNSPADALRVPLSTRIINVSEINHEYDKTAGAILQFETSPLIGTDRFDVKAQSSLEWLNDCSQSTHQELIERLNCLSNYCHAANVPITSTEFDSFVDIFTKRLLDFNENEVIASLQIFARMPIDKMKLGERNFHELWAAIDDNCARSAMEWDVGKRLAVCPIWSGVPVARKSKFAQMICNKFKQDLNDLSAKEMVAAVIFMNNTAQFIDNRAFEKNFNRVLDDLTVDDIGLLCCVFNRENYSIHQSELIERLLSRVLAENIDDMPDRALRQILKTIRMSARSSQHGQIIELLEKLRLQVDRRRMSTCARFIAVAEIFNEYDPIIMETVLQRAAIDNRDLSFFDCANICKALIMTNYKSPTGQEHIFLANVLKRIREQPRDVMFSAKAFHSLVYYLAILGYHDAEVIDNALGDDFLYVAYNRPQYLITEVYGLNAFVQLNLTGHYQGNLLTQKYHKKLKKVMKHAQDIKNHSKSFGAIKMLRTFAEIMDTLNWPYQIGLAVPHYTTADLYVVFDQRTGNVVNVEQRFPDAYTGKFIRKEDFVGSDENLAVVALIASYWHDLCRADMSPNGFMRLKIDQLKLLGFQPLLINHFSWVSLEENERSLFIQNEIKKLFSKLKGT